MLDGGWEEAVELTRWTRAADGWTCGPGGVEPPIDLLADTYCALITGLRDYVEKNGFPGIVLGLSGGVDSALSAAVGVDALGPDRVLGVRLPSPFTGQVSMEEAQYVADRLGIRLLTLPIEQVMTQRRGDAGAGVRRPARGTSPKRTCRPAFAGFC